jgi:hypothetical protein
VAPILLSFRVEGLSFQTTFSYISSFLHAGLVKAAMGAAAGGVLGLLLFRTGKGGRMASVATGVGAGLGSAYERARPTLFGNPQK